MKASLQTKIDRVQKLLNEQNIDGWLLYDFRKSNPLACKFLDIPKDQLLTRRFFYWIPKKGAPIKLISYVENPLIHLPGNTEQFLSWHQLEESLQKVLGGSKKVAMEYSPKNSIPEISRVDAGTIELIRGFNIEVVSSGDLLQEFTCVWDLSKIESHRRAAKVLEMALDKAWDFIASALKSGQSITEYDVQQLIVKECEKQNCLTEHPPICAVNQHSANPHYTPDKKGASLIQKEDFILIDLWCKEDAPHSVYADFTQVGVASKKPSDKQEEVFAIVKEARDAALGFIKERQAKGVPIFGFEIDTVCREVIETSGYGEFFVHRTGHNIDELDHGPGAHIDNLETHDTRKILPNSCFSIEPGIYLPGEFGVRLECDVILHEKGVVEITGSPQDSIKTLL